MSSGDMAALRALAERLPDWHLGEWYTPPRAADAHWHTVYQCNEGSTIADVAHPDTAAYIAAASPAAVLALLDENARMREALGLLEKAAGYTQKLGAVTGAHWLGLGTALIKARAALGRPRA